MCRRDQSPHVSPEHLHHVLKGGLDSSHIAGDDKESVEPVHKESRSERPAALVATSATIMARLTGCNHANPDGAAGPSSAPTPYRVESRTSDHMRQCVTCLPGTNSWHNSFFINSIKQKHPFYRLLLSGTNCAEHEHRRIRVKRKRIKSSAYFFLRLRRFHRTSQPSQINEILAAHYVSILTRFCFFISDFLCILACSMAGCQPFPAIFFCARPRAGRPGSAGSRRPPDAFQRAAAGP